MSISFKPIDKWPRELTRYRKHSPFKASYGSTMSLLERELRRAGARNAIVQLALLPGEFRRDGMPYSNANPQHPGVIFSFEKGKDPLAFPCDAYLTWVENLRAVALALEALRKVDRYGVTKHAEQYRGWQALPPGSRDAIVTPPPMTVEQAAWFLSKAAGQPERGVAAMKMREAFDDLYRAAAKRLHPDANGGSDQSAWLTLQGAAEVLGKHYGI